MSAIQSDLLLLFQKPFEPISTTRKNGDETVQFEFTDNFLESDPAMIEISQRFGSDVDRKVSIKNVGDIDISFADEVRKDGPFSLFIKKHRTIASRLILILYTSMTIDSFLSTAAYIKDRLNPYLFQYVLAVAMSHNAATKELDVPPIMSIFPDQFVDPAVFKKVRQEANLVSPENRSKIKMPMLFTASNMEIEQNLAYFREDIGINSHHWHWHMVYPADGPRPIVNKDRRGELFAYMHLQILNRYNIERFAHYMPATIPMADLKAQMSEGYSPKIIRSSNNRAYPPRLRNYFFKDINREVDDVYVSISEMQLWRDRIFDAIDSGYVVNEKNEKVSINNNGGIDILSNIIEASQLSVNPKFYGDIHNQGHMLIGYVHDCQGNFLEDYGVMGDVATAMRDPLFYRWHAFINDIFYRHKDNLNPYTEKELIYEDVKMLSITTHISKDPKAEENVLLTHWQNSDVDLSTGLDFGPEGDVYAEFTHLQHEAFHYKITVENLGQIVKKGTCRIFITPENNNHGPLKIDQQFKLFIELDKFTVTMTPGENTIIRRSDESNITIPYSRTFRKIGVANTPVESHELEKFRFCGCGWPQHMLLPKGNTTGMKFILFAMISNYDDDTIGFDYDPNVNCNEAASYCGLRDQKYPDKRSMGYPFDKKLNYSSIKDFLKSNMITNDIVIKFRDIVKST